MPYYNTYVEYHGDGATTDYSIPFPYSDTVDVSVVRKSGAVSYSFINSNTIRLSEPLAVGDVLTVSRVTAVDQPVVIFRNGAVQTAQQLNAIVNQLIYSQQEVRDIANRGLFKNTLGLWDFGGSKAINLGAPEAATDAVTKGYGDANYGGTAAAVAQTSAQSASASANAAAQSATAAQTAAAQAQAVAGLDLSGYLTKDDNLASLTDFVVARTNLDVYSTSEVSTALAGKANTSHTHTKAQITDLTVVSTSSAGLVPQLPASSAGQFLKDDGTFAAIPDNGVPAGTVLHLARNTAPTGYLKANGALVSRTTYANLFAAIGTTFGAGDGSTTFALPDLRGEFIRGWDDARGVDASRAFGSLQAQDVQPHAHTASSSFSNGTAASAGAHTHTVATVTASGSSSGPGSVSGSPSSATTSSSGAHTHTVTGTVATTVNNSTGTETRPRNVALLAVIKY